MKYQVLIVLMAIALTVTTSNATIWIVDNNPGHDHDFTDLAIAQATAQPGDTIYVVGSNLSYGSLDLIKPLIWVGNGYFIADNYGQQANLLASRLGDIDFEENATGSVMMGMTLNSLDIYADNILITRNTVPSGAIILSGANHCIISSTFIVRWSNSDSGHPIRVENSSNEVIVCNNYIQRHSGSGAIYIGDNCSADIYNNVVQGSFTVFNSYVHNNIGVWNDAYFQGTNNVVQYNISAGTTFGDDNNNQINVLMDIVFVGGNSPDGQWQLAADSPAIGAGVNGEDCGMFGGLTPYVISGIPSIPTISTFFAPSAASSTSGLPVQVQINSRN